MTQSKREREIIYFALSRLLDDKECRALVDHDKLSTEEFYEIDNLRDQYYDGNEMPTY